MLRVNTHFHFQIFNTRSISNFSIKHAQKQGASANINPDMYLLKGVLQVKFSKNTPMILAVKADKWLMLWRCTITEVHYVPLCPLSSSLLLGPCGRVMCTMCSLKTLNCCVWLKALAVFEKLLGTAASQKQ
jgi:hypothetical protein